MSGNQPYTYAGVVIGNYDGDTITIDVDLGFRVWARKMKFRLFGIDAPEMRGEDSEAGRAARDYLAQVLPPGSKVMLDVVENDKYGRWVSNVTDSHGNDISTLMVAAGHAVKRSY